MDEFASGKDLYTQAGRRWLKCWDGRLFIRVVAYRFKLFGSQFSTGTETDLNQRSPKLMKSKSLLSFLLICALMFLPAIVYAAGDLPEAGTMAPDFQLTTNEGNQA